MNRVRGCVCCGDIISFHISGAPCFQSGVCCFGLGLVEFSPALIGSGRGFGVWLSVRWMKGGCRDTNPDAHHAMDLPLKVHGVVRAATLVHLGGPSGDENPRLPLAIPCENTRNVRLLSM